MNGAWLVAILLVAAGVTAVWRRRRFASERPAKAADGDGGTVKRVEAYAFPVLGALIAAGALVYWEPWLSIAGLAIGALFLFAGLASYRDLRRRRVS
jgi:hypothetical protein